MDLFDYSEITIENLQFMMEDFDLIETYDTELDRNPSQKIKFSARFDGDPVVGTAIWTIKDSKGYFVIFASTPKDFREYSSVAALMEKSFQINGNSDNKSHGSKNPVWLKSIARWWAVGSITNNDFADGVQLLVDEKIIKIHESSKHTSGNIQEKMPDWIRYNAIWWVEGLISEDEFVVGIQYLAQQGIIKVK